MNPSVQNSVFQKHTAVVSTRSPVKQESDSLVPGVFCMLSPHLVSQSLQMWAIHQLSTHTPLCVCVCAPVYDEHKDDCHPQSCVWVKKIYIFREVWIRFTSLGRNPRKQPATEISVMKNKNTYLMCQRGTVDPTPGKWKWEDGCKGHRCYLFFFFLLPQVFITPLTDPKAHIYLGQTCFWMWTVASESLTPLFFSKHFYFLFLLNLNGWISKPIWVESVNVCIWYFTHCLYWLDVLNTEPWQSELAVFDSRFLCKNYLKTEYRGVLTVKARSGTWYLPITTWGELRRQAVPFNSFKSNSVPNLRALFHWKTTKPPITT